MNDNEITPLLQGAESDNSQSSSSVPPAGPLEAGAVGGDGPPQPSDSCFNAAAKEADKDYQTNNKTNNQTKNQTNNQTNNKTNLNKPQPRHETTNHNDKYFKGDTYPRYLVLKHRDPGINIATLNSFYISDGLKAVMSERQYGASTLKYLFHSRLILIEVDGRDAAQKLLATKRIGNIPVKVEIHKTKNTIKGSIFTSNFLDMSDEEFLERLTRYNVVDVFNVPKRDKTGKSPRYFLTFAGQTLPPEILAEGLSIKVEAIKASPRRCPKCQEFNHGERSCVKERVCCKCGKQTDHSFKDCPNEAHCINCGQKHPSSSPQCPLYQIEEAVIRRKAATNVDVGAARKFIIRTHALVDQVPILRQQRDKLPPTMADIVSNAQQKNQPKFNNPPQPQLSQQTDINRYLKPLESKIEAQSQQLAEQTKLIKQQARTIETLHTCMLGLINTPALRERHVAIDGSLQDLQDRGVIDQAQCTNASDLISKSVDEATDTRKSRSRSRKASPKSRKSSRSKSKKSSSRTPLPKQQKPANPNQGEKRKADSSGDLSPERGARRPHSAHTPRRKARTTSSPPATSPGITPLDMSLSKVVDLTSHEPPPQQGTDHKAPSPPPLPPPTTIDGVALGPLSLDPQSPAYQVTDKDGVQRLKCRTRSKSHLT